MRIQRTFRLITLAMVATTVSFASYMWVEHWRAYVTARRSEAVLQAFRAMLISAERASAERGPSNAVLGTPPFPSADMTAALSRARELSDASLRTAIAMLQATDCPDCGQASVVLEQARTQLTQARARVDLLLAQPLDKRHDVQAAVGEMFAVIDRILPATDGLIALLQRSAPVAAQHAGTARVSAELREYAGRAGSEFTSSLLANRPLHREEHNLLARDFGRIQTLGEQIQQRVDHHLLADTRLREAETALRQRYFGDGIAYLQQVEALAPGESRPSTAELASTYVPLMAPIVAMRDAELDAAQAAVESDTTHAQRLLGVLAAVLALTTVFLIISFWLFAHRVLQPLTRATAATVDLAEGRYDVLLPAQPKPDEIGAIWVALEQVRTSLLQKVSLEHERTALIEQLQAAAEQDRAQMRELAQARDAAEASARAKSSFLAMMSHEIRTPLHGILGLLELLEHSPLSADQQRSLRLARESGQALGQILDDVLDYAKLEASRLRITPTPLDLRALLSSVLSLMAPRAEAKALSMEQRVLPAVPAQVLADGIRLRQILLNLLGNAIKFTERGAVELRATVEMLGPNEAVLVLTVKDSGIGIAKADIEWLFTPFVQSESGATRRFDGTGLGLAISRQLAQLMGGELTLESELGVGTRVTLHLPLPAHPDGTPPDTWGKAMDATVR